MKEILPEFYQLFHHSVPEKYLLELFVPGFLIPLKKIDKGKELHKHFGVNAYILDPSKCNDENSQNLPDNSEPIDREPFEGLFEKLTKGHLLFLDRTVGGIDEVEPRAPVTWSTA